MFSPVKRLLLGRPLPTSAAKQERLSTITGLAVLSSDALSSVAYATDAMLAALAPAGLVALNYSRPLAFLVAGLLIIVTLSYRQTIHAYPQGGGAYIVAKDNLGILPGLVAATALLIDYYLRSPSAFRREFQQSSLRHLRWNVIASRSPRAALD